MRDTERSLQQAPPSVGCELDEVLLVSTYELGHVPAGITQPAAWLRRAGHRVSTLDLAVEDFDPERVRRADAVAFSIPMHTATRLAFDAIERVRAIQPQARLAAFGLYAPQNAERLAKLGVLSTFAGEIEPLLVDWAGRVSPSAQREIRARAKPPLLVSDRAGLPTPDRYASVVLADGTHRVAGYVEASRGCKHRCRHCPVVPIYDGHFRVVNVETVLEDVATQVAAGVRHITFGDPDFLNGPRHAEAVVEQFARRFPEVSYDVTAKVEHLLALPELVDRLESTGCLFVTTAVESMDDFVLGVLDKGHSAEAFRVLAGRFRDRELGLAPTLIPFTPWTTLEGYRDLLAELVELALVEAVAPVQLAIRLLVPSGSLLMGRPELHGMLGDFDEDLLSHPWSVSDSAVAQLELDVRALVEQADGRPRKEVFADLWVLAHRALGREAPELALEHIAPVPRSSEAWYCCAEPARREPCRAVAGEERAS